MNTNYNSRYEDPTREELAEICRQLDIEYRGAGVQLNLSSYLSQELRTRIQRFHYYNALMPRIINTENTNYVVPPRREYTDGEGERLPDDQLAYIDMRMEEMALNVTMGDASKTVAFMGTLAMLPEVDETDDTHNLITLTPMNCTWKVMTHIRFPSKATQLEYVCDKIRYVYDSVFFSTYSIRKGGEDVLIDQVAHGYVENASSMGGMPWAITRVPYDPTRFWGAPDTSMRDICEMQRFLGAGIIAATQGNLQDILVLNGMTDEDAAVQTYDRPTGKVVHLRAEKDDDGKAIPKSAYFINPSYLEPKAIEEIWQERWQEFQRSRGHSAKNFEVGASPQSAEAQRLSDAGVGNDNAYKRTALVKFEQDVFKRWVQMNNKNPNNVQIPIDAQVSIFWQDDLSPTVDEQLKQDQFDLDNNLKTQVDLIMDDTPELSREQATAKYVANLKFSSEINAEADIEETPEEVNETTNTNIEDEDNSNPTS